MSETLYGLTATNMQRVANAVRTVEAEPARPAAGQANRRERETEFWALLGTEGTGSNAGKYRWSKVVPQQGGSGFIASPPPWTAGRTTAPSNRAPRPASPGSASA